MLEKLGNKIFVNLRRQLRLLCRPGPRFLVLLRFAGWPGRPARAGFPVGAVLKAGIVIVDLCFVIVAFVAQNFVLHIFPEKRELRDLLDRLVCSRLKMN